MSIFDWSTTAASNTTVDGVGIQEGMNGSAVNNAIRGLMRVVRLGLRDLSGYTTSTGAGTAYLLTTSSTLTTLEDGVRLTWLPNVTNTVACTLNVDTLGAKKMLASGADLVAGNVIAGQPIDVVYDASADGGAGAWLVLNPVPVASTFSASQITNDSTVTGTNVDDALEHLDTDIASLQSGKANLTGGNTYTGAQTTDGLITAGSGVIRGTDHQLAGGTDLNTVLTAGTYQLSNPVNGPPDLLNNWMYLQVYRRADLYVWQEAFELNNPGAQRKWIRRNHNGAWGSWDQVVTGANIAEFASGGVPPGSVMWFAATAAPTGFLKANGALVSRTAYSDLFAAIGTAFGIGDGSTTFNLPDLRGEFIRAWDDARGVDSGRAFGSYQADEYRSHSHGYGARPFGGNNTQGGSTFAFNGGLTQASGGTETRPRNVALLACIKF